MQRTAFSSGTHKGSILRTTPVTGIGRGILPSVTPGKVSTKRGGSCNVNAVYSTTAVVCTTMRTFSANVSVIIPVITARPGVSCFPAVGRDADGGVTLQPPHHRVIVNMLMNTPGRRGERFTCLSFLLVLASKRDIEGFRDF